MKEEAASSTCRPAGPGVWKANTRELLHVPSAGNDECQLQTATENQQPSAEGKVLTEGGALVGADMRPKADDNFRFGPNRAERRRADHTGRVRVVRVGKVREADGGEGSRDRRKDRGVQQRGNVERRDYPAPDGHAPVALVPFRHGSHRGRGEVDAVGSGGVVELSLERRPARVGQQRVDRVRAVGCGLVGPVVGGRVEAHFEVGEDEIDLAADPLELREPGRHALPHRAFVHVGPRALYPPRP